MIEETDDDDDDAMYRSKPPHHPNRVIEATDDADLDAISGDEGNGDLDITEKPAESAEAELSKYQFRNFIERLTWARTTLKELDLPHLCFFPLGSSDRVR